MSDEGVYILVSCDIVGLLEEQETTMTELTFARIGQLEREREDDAFVPELHQDRMADAMARIDPLPQPNHMRWRDWN